MVSRSAWSPALDRALVGGCYLAGKLDELESFARSLTMRRIAAFSTSPSRRRPCSAGCG